MSMKVEAWNGTTEIIEFFGCLRVVLLRKKCKPLLVL